MLTDECRSKLLRMLEEEPPISQRSLASKLGIGLGKADDCVQAWRSGVWSSQAISRTARTKRPTYIFLQEKGIAEKSRVTSRFLRSTMAQYEALDREIEELKRQPSDSP